MKELSVLSSFVLLVLVGCSPFGGPSIEPTPAELPVQIEVENLSDVQLDGEIPEGEMEDVPGGTRIRYQLVAESEGYASCVDYSLMDGEGNVVELSGDVADALICPGVLPRLATDDLFMLYVSDEWGTLYLYDFETKKSTSLMSFYDDTAGISLLEWSPDGKSIAMIVVNYDRMDYPEITKLFILTFEGGVVTEKKKYNVRVNFSCGSAICSPGVGDLIWDGDDRVRYRTWKDSPYDLEGDDAWRVQSL